MGEASSPSAEDRESGSCGVSGHESIIYDGEKSFFIWSVRGVVRWHDIGSAGARSAHDVPQGEEGDGGE